MSERFLDIPAFLQRGVKAAPAPASMTETRAALLELKAATIAERDFNQRWIARHLHEGFAGAAIRRGEIVAQRERWIAALDEVLRRPAEDAAS